MEAVMHGIVPLLPAVDECPSVDGLTRMVDSLEGWPAVAAFVAFLAFLAFVLWLLWR
jgi:hypothetical protein